METSLGILSRIPLFDGLPHQQLAQIAGISVEKQYTKGQTIFSEGDPGDGFYVVADGQVKIYKLSADGKEQILHIFGPGQPFGEVPVFSGRSFPAHALSLSKTRLLFFPRQSFVALISQTPSLALNMLAVLSMRLRQFTVQVEQLSLKEVPARLAAYLLYLAEKQAEATEVQLEISKGQLASLLGTIPETLSRIFARMSSQKLIAVDGRRIQLLDKVGLAELAEAGTVESAS